MMALLYVNTIVFGVIGVLFGLLGSNVQSRLFGLVALGCMVANALVAGL